MPSSIAHMLISRSVREELKKDKDPGMKKFAEEVLGKNGVFMELGALGPDLPYYESMAKGVLNLIFDKSDKPMGVDQWSYQLHAKDPNVFPLKMIEITWKETAMEKEDWEEDDFMKFAFICGFLTHMAADQIIHPVVSLLAGPYYKRGKAREKHRECEVYQDVFIYNELKERFGLKGFRREAFNEWCDIMPGLNLSLSGSDNTPVWFRYLVQKSFIEAHAVAPSEDAIENWADGILIFLRSINNFGPFNQANSEFPDGEKFREYIKFETDITEQDFLRLKSALIGTKTYTDFFQDAVMLASVYVKAAWKIFESNLLDDAIREKFKSVVFNADLSSPLENNILKKAEAALESWK